MTRHRPHQPARSPKPLSRAQKEHRAAKATWIWVGVGVAVVLVVLALLLWPRGGEPREISAAQAFGKYQQQAFFLDVRGAQEWNASHIPGSVDIPLDELPSRLTELPKDREIVVVCRSGVRSAEGTRVLVAAGFDDVSSLRGGLQAWSAAGYPLERGSP